MTVAERTDPRVEKLRRRFSRDTVFYAEKAVRIIDQDQENVPLKANKAQRLFEDAMRRQDRAGKPIRIIILKARKLGFSTWTQAKIFQRASLTANHKAVVAAHDRPTAGELFGMSQVIYANLPEDEELGLRPPLRHTQQARLMAFGGNLRSGDLGLNSSILVDTAGSVQAGRGFTYHSLHLSEVAFWPDAKTKLTSLLNTVPKRKGTMVVIESTANGDNHFKTLWDRYWNNPDGEFIALFFAWHEHPEYQVRFPSPEERQRFIESIGTGEWGAEEPGLIENYGCTPEQLAWRRLTLETECQADLRIFHQEYPSNPEEAFMSTGDRVFDPMQLKKVERVIFHTDPKPPSKDRPGPQIGRIEHGRLIRSQARYSVIERPADPVWKPGTERDSYWRVWRHPDRGELDEAGKWRREPGRYVIGVDVSGGERGEDSSRDQAYHAICVLDHKTRHQVAEYRSRVDEDLLARHAYLAALYYNDAYVAIEVTGGWGMPVARIIWQDFRFPFTYFRQTHDRSMERSLDRLGWETNRMTKPIIIAGAKEALRTEDHGIHSRLLLSEMRSYIKDPRTGKTKPSPGSHSDFLIAWMIAQQVAQEKPLRKIKAPAGGGRRHSYLRGNPDPVTGI